MATMDVGVCSGRGRIVTALVVYESMFGNTEMVAGAIADGLAEHVRVRLVEVGEAPAVLPDDVELLVVGAPTHAFRMSTAQSRQAAAQQLQGGEILSMRIGVREWLAALPAARRGVAAAAFDTVVERPRWIRWFGAAGRGVEKRLRRLGFGSTAPAEHFLVSGTKGPLAAGEQERAHEWGARIGAALGARVLR